MSRRHRPLTAFLAVLALLVAQFVVSAHACGLVAQAAPATMAQAHDCCDEADPGPADAGTCLAHCQYGNASFDAGHALPVVLAPGGPFFRLEVASMAPGAVDGRVTASSAPASGPPALVRFGVRRI